MERRKFIARAILFNRKRIGLKQMTLAKAAKLSPAHMSRIENAHCEVRQSSLDRIAAALGMTTSALLDDADRLAAEQARKNRKDALYPVDPPRRDDEEVAEKLREVTYFDDDLPPDDAN